MRGPRRRSFPCALLLAVALATGATGGGCDAAPDPVSGPLPGPASTQDGCMDDADCGAGKVCKTVTVSCTACGNEPGCSCSIAICLRSPPFCNDDANCAPGESCGGKYCSCETASQCGGGTGYTCRDGVCAPIRCNDDTDCCLPDGSCGACELGGLCAEFIESPADPTWTCGYRGPARGAPAWLLLVAALWVLRGARAVRT